MKDKDEIVDEFEDIEQDEQKDTSNTQDQDILTTIIYSSNGVITANILFGTLGFIMSLIVIVHRSSIRKILKASDNKITKANKKIIINHLNTIAFDASFIRILSVLNLVYSLGRTMSLIATHNSGNAALMFLVMTGINIFGVISSTILKSRVDKAVAEIE